MDNAQDNSRGAGPGEGPLFSVVTVTRDDLDGLRRTWRSLSDQQCRDWEWVVVDGASSDGTAQWLESLEPGPDWSSEPDTGIFDAMNKGMARARGRYLLFLNGGDELAAPDVLSRVAAAVRVSDSRPDLAWGDAVRVDLQGREFPAPARPLWYLPWGMITLHQAMFFSREAVGGRQYPEEYRLAADYAFIGGLVRDVGPDGVFTPLDCTVARFHLGGASQVHRLKGIAECRRIRRRVMGRSWAFAALVYALEFCMYHLKKRFPVFMWRCISSRRF